MSELNNKQEVFCQEYLVDLNGKQAAIRAGYSEKTAEQQASRLLSNVKVSDRIKELKSDRCEEVKIDAAYVLRRHAEIDQMDIADIITDEGYMKSLREWPKVWRQYISGFDLAELFEGHGEERQMTGLLKKIKWPDKVKNLELLGKHVDVQAYNTKLDHVSSDGSMTPVVLTSEDADKIRQEMLNQDDC